MSNHTIYHMLGQIAVTFASIEHRITELLEYLLVEDCSLVKPYVLDRLSLNQCVQKTRAVAKLRLWGKDKTRSELKAVLDAIDAVRKERNWFIHGDWFSENLTDYSSSVTVLNYKPRLQPNGVWEYLEQNRVTKLKLKNLLAKTSSALDDLNTVHNKIRKLKLR